MQVTVPGETVKAFKELEAYYRERLREWRSFEQRLGATPRGADSSGPNLAEGDIARGSATAQALADFLALAQGLSGVEATRLFIEAGREYLSNTEAEASGLSAAGSGAGLSASTPGGELSAAIRRARLGQLTKFNAIRPHLAALEALCLGHPPAQPQAVSAQRFGGPGIYDSSDAELDAAGHSRRVVDALILRGGGVKGLAFAGAIKELEKHYYFHSFVGASAGAIAAVLLAAGLTGAELELELRKKQFRDLLTPKYMGALLHLTMRGGLHAGDALQEWVAALLRNKLAMGDPIAMADLPRRAVAYASNRLRGPVCFDSASAREDSEAAFAVRCSASLPLFFAASTVDNNPVYDGGLLNNFPIQVFLEQERALKPDGQTPTFIALYLGTPANPGGRGQARGPISVVRDCLGILLSRDERYLAERQYVDQVVNIDVRPVRTVDFMLTDDEKDLLVLKGQLAALEFLNLHGGLKEQAQNQIARDLIAVRQASEEVSSRVRLRRTRRRLVKFAKWFLVALTLWAAVTVIRV